MKNSRIIILLIMLFISTTCFAGEDRLIDKYLEGEIAKDSTTTGMNNATLKAMEKWDVEMNEYYKLLMGTSDEKSQAILRTSQRAWIDYRDKEFKNIDNVFGQIQGTIYTAMAIANKNGIVRERALKLKEYYELLKEK